MKFFLQALVVIGWTAFVAGVFYKTGRGDAYDVTDQLANLSRRARAAEEALEVMTDAWTECVLSEPIRFPADTALRETD